MSSVPLYYQIRPGKKRIKTAITRISLLLLGHAFQTAYRIDETVTKEVNSWPPTFSFVFQVEPGGPQMVIVKRNGVLQYLGEKEIFSADVAVCIKNIEFGFQAMVGLLSTPKMTFENKQFVKGDLTMLSSIIRCLNVCQLIMLPNVIARFYIKKVPPLTWKMIKNRITFYALGSWGMIK